MLPTKSSFLSPPSYLCRADRFCVGTRARPRSHVQPNSQLPSVGVAESGTPPTGQFIAPPSDILPTQLATPSVTNQVQPRRSGRSNRGQGGSTAQLEKVSEILEAQSKRKKPAQEFPSTEPLNPLAPPPPARKRKVFTFAVSHNRPFIFSYACTEGQVDQSTFYSSRSYFAGIFTAGGAAT